MVHPILALAYSDGLEADRHLSEVGYRLRAEGIKVAGLVQLNTFVRDRTKCDMAVEELFSGTILQLSEDRGRDARGCRLDRSVLADAASLLLKALESKPDILVLNKFGKVEAEGGGLRDVLAAALDLGIPVLVGVPFRNIDQWRAFAGDMAQECQLGSCAIKSWLKVHKIGEANAYSAARDVAASVGFGTDRPSSRIE
jgi:nucleoside-triphosphatase THEP1